MPAHRSFVLLLAFVMALGALVPLVAPPRTEAISTDIVISEFRTRGSAGAADEFVELHNRSGLAVDVSGWLVRRSNNTGFNATQVTIPAGTSIGPGCFYLVANSAGYSGSSAADATYSVGIADDGGIGVQTPGGAVVDAVGMSALSFYQEGTNLAPLTANTDQGYERKPGGTTGHTDTDDNATDFAVLAPSNPQNSSSPCLTITGPTSPSGVGTANPPSVEPGDTSLLSVTVTPGANPASTGVTVTGNLSSITGYSDAEEFADPDLDNVFTFQITVPETEAPGTRNLGITVADAQGRSSTTSIALTVEAPPTSIWEIQGAGHLSPYDDQQVFGVEGVVTATRIGNSGGFWMTHPTGDGDPATSDGIFIFKPGTQAVAVGDAVSVSGTVDEFRPGFDAGFENLTITEIINPSVTVMSSGNPLPVTVIGDGGRMPPSDVIDDDTLADGGGGDGTIDGPGAVTTYDPANDGIDFYESLEGMYVQVNDAVAVGPRTGVGEIAIVGDGGDHAGPFTSRGGLIIGPGAFNPERIHLDDALRPTPMVNVGDTFTTAVNGVIDYSFGNFKLLPTTALVGVDNGLVREAADATGPRELAVATYNVENLTVGNPQAKFDELADQIIHNLRSPDLIAIEEMQDDSGGTNNGVVTAQQGWAKLITTIANRGGPVYQFRSIDPANNADGGAFGGNIRVGFLFRTDRGLEFVDRPGGNATTDTGVVATPNGKAARLTISPGRVLPDPAGPHANAFVDTRKSLAGEFRWRGETLFVVANHLSSKGDDHPLFGRFQPPVRFTEFASGTPEDGWRHAQAQVLNDFVDKILAVDEDAHVIVLGDINDFHDSETVGVLTGELVAGSGGPDLDGSGPTLPSGDAPVLATLFDGLPADERYSYVFEGNSQVLDQILVSTSLVALDPRYDVVHVNAEFASQASDHDPSVMRVSFQPRRGR